MAPKDIDKEIEKRYPELSPEQRASIRIGYLRAVARRPERKEMEKKFDELLSLVCKKDRAKALKLMWGIFYHPGMRPTPIELLWALGKIEKEMKKLGIPIYLALELVAP